jgi:selenocysteine lyase/cysteine desulfurase
VREIGAAIKAARPDVVFVVDSMSGFGALPIEVHPNIDFLISSPNKCLEGVPGFAFVVAKREQLLASAGSARTLSLDLLAQWRALEADGQFRFTPPTQALLAFRQALREHRARLPHAHAAHGADLQPRADDVRGLREHRRERTRRRGSRKVAQRRWCRHGSNGARMRNSWWRWLSWSHRRDW